MSNFKYFKDGEKNWFRDFAEENKITFKELTTTIFPNTKPRTLQNLWQKRTAANGCYADALIWYAKAKRKNWIEA